MKVTISELSPADIASLTASGMNGEELARNRQKVTFTDEDGSSGILYIENEIIDRLGSDYLGENTILEYSSLLDEWLPKVSENAYYNDTDRFPQITIELRYVCDLSGENAEIYEAIESGRIYMRKLSSRNNFAKWLSCSTRYGDGNEIRANVTFICKGQTERVKYDDWNGPAAYSDTYNKNFRGEQNV